MGKLKPFSEFIASLRQLAAEKPRAHRTCTYFKQDRKGNWVPNCIAGEVFVHCGTPIDECNLELSDGNVLFLPSLRGTEGRLKFWNTLGYEPPTENQILWADWVQVAQDSRKTWKSAVAYADSLLGAVQ